MRDCMFDAEERPVHMFWEAARSETSQLPAQATFNPLDPRFYQTHVVRAFPRGSQTLTDQIDGMPDRVTLRVRLQPIGIDVLDELVESGDLDPAIRDVMPTFDLAVGDAAVLEWTAATANGQYLEQGLFPVSCITETNVNVAADKVPAPEIECKP
jgi:hypothetical protein